MTLVGAGFSVDCASLIDAARAASEIAQEAGVALRHLQAAGDEANCGAPGTQTALAAQQFHVDLQLDQQIRDLHEIARRLELTASNYHHADLRAAEEIGRANLLSDT